MVRTAEAIEACEHRPAWLTSPAPAQNWWKYLHAGLCWDVFNVPKAARINERSCLPPDTQLNHAAVPVGGWRHNVQPGFLSTSLLVMSIKVPCLPKRKTLQESKWWREHLGVIAGLSVQAYAARLALNGHLMSDLEGQGLGEETTGIQPEIWVSDHCFLVRTEEGKKSHWWKYRKCTTSVFLFIHCFMAKGRLWAFLCCKMLLLVFFSLLFYFCLEKIYDMFKMTAEWNIAFPVK